MKRPSNSRKCERGFTLTEMLIATAVILVGLVAVAELVPVSVMLNSNNRNDATALVLAQRQLEAMREVPMSSTTFMDPLGVLCPPSTTCSIGDPTQPLQAVGSPVVLDTNNTPLIDFSASPVSGYSFTYTDVNDPFRATNDVRWAVITFTNPLNNAVTGKRIILGVFRRGMRTPTLPVTLDALVSK
ncbi:MAG TPA: prepilin-type N-terminal cleavage/methylation domain-containing protein [Verrucomicrobiae bacterium]|nr:prepilin-type N-terminal cleavage/methylation domain-containing protein [Verrucomicrobiae bacterium]